MHRQLIISTISFAVACAELLVDLPDGRVRGIEVNTEKYTYNAYRGIPFAKPPVGNLRFQAPVPNDPWDGILNATEPSPCCISVAFTQADQVEDCLYINVFTPINVTGKLPVMFWIYGGGLKDGCGVEDYYGPGALVSEDVIVVTSNYRLGVYGFLSTQDNVVLGNAGLKDQLLAMKWTQRNIEYFGGDPEKITIFGESAGGVSVGAHVANKKSEGLYRAAICQSGCSLANISIMSQTNPRQSALKIVRTINPFLPNDISSEEIRDFLQLQPASVLTQAFQTADPETGIVVEVEDENAYVTDFNFGLIESGNFPQVPLVIGTTSGESLAFFGILPPLVQILAIAFDTNPSFVIPSNFVPLPGTNLNEIGAKITHAYTNSSYLADSAAVVDLTSDSMFVRSSLKQAELQSKYSPVYFYEFAFSGEANQQHPNIKEYGKIGHGEDVTYIFDVPLYKVTTEQDFLMRSKMVKLWTNFAKTLNPTPDESDPLLNVTWPQVSGKNIPYLLINDTLEIKPGKKSKEMAMWDDVFYTYGQQPFAGF